MTVKNRFARSATNDWLGNVDGSVSDKEVDIYRNLAANDVGLIISAHSYVEHPRGRASFNQNGIYDDRFISGYRRLAGAVHEYGAKIVVQISHAATQTTSQVIENQYPFDPNKVEEYEILALIDAFAAAVLRVKKAGCDGVQIHMAHGYLLSRFLSPDTNRRQDDWGGTPEKRVRVFIEIIKRAKSLVGADFPILVKLNSMGGFNGTAAVELEDVIYTAKLLEGLGVCAIEVSGGVAREPKNSMARVGILHSEQEAYFAAAASQIKKAVNIPIILVGGLRSQKVMERILDEEVADMVSLCRPFIREPDLVCKLKGGQPKVACVSCNLCFDPSGIKCNYKEKSPDSN